jgi:hypothetical protein
MKLGAWIEKEIREGRATGKKDAYAKLAAKTKATGGESVSSLTVENAAGGMRLKKYDKAKVISLATGGEVTIPELCE